MHISLLLIKVLEKQGDNYLVEIPDTSLTTHISVDVVDTFFKPLNENKSFDEALKFLKMGKSISNPQCPHIHLEKGTIVNTKGEAVMLTSSQLLATTWRVSD